MESFGNYLKSNREKKGIRLEEIASITKINLHTLEAMEADKWDELPAEPFIKGFITAYCKYVGLNANEIIELYKSEVKKIKEPNETKSISELKTTNETELHPIESKSEIKSQTNFSYKRVAVVTSVLLLVTLITVLIYIGKKNFKIASRSYPKKNIITEVTKADKTSEMPATVTNTENENFNHNISIIGKERTWVKVVIDDSLPLEFFLPEGNTVSYKAKEKIKVVLGNSVGSKVIHNGTETEGQKLIGTIRYYIFPENAKFPQDTPTRKTTTDSTTE